MSTITTTLAPIKPIQGVPDGKGSTDPAVRQAWLDQRYGGVTATDIRDCHQGSKRREIITEKVLRVGEDLSNIPAVNHGNLREPLLADWVHGKFGITPCDYVYAHGENPRYLASPDGITVDPFSKELRYGTQDAVLCEIKTSRNDLHPGKVTDDPIPALLEITPDSKFDRSGYYTQMQWQMFVMNANACLFVWEQRLDEMDPETKTFKIAGPPQFVLVPRDQKLIDRLANDVAPALLAEIDAAVTANTSEMPPVAPGLDAERAKLVADLLRAREAEAVAAEAKKAAWSALQEHFLAEGAPDVKITIDGFATVSVATSTTMKKVVDMDAARKRAPKKVAEYEALIKRYTHEEPSTSRRLTVTEPRATKVD